MQDPIDIDKTLMEMYDPFMLRSIDRSEPTEEGKEEMKSFGGGHSRTLEEEISGIDNLLLRVRVDPSKGRVFWTDPPATWQKPGDEAGSLHRNGYTYICLGRKKYLRHRVVFYYANKYLPVMLDHKHGKHNGDGLANLQEISFSANQMKKSLMTTNTSGHRGVSWCKRAEKWRVSIKKDRKQIHIGYTDDLDTAGRMYNSKAVELFGEFAMLNDKMKEKKHGKAQTE